MPASILLPARQPEDPHCGKQGGAAYPVRFRAYPLALICRPGAWPSRAQLGMLLAQLIQLLLVNQETLRRKESWMQRSRPGSSSSDRCAAVAYIPAGHAVSPMLFAARSAEDSWGGWLPIPLGSVLWRVTHPCRHSYGTSIRLSSSAGFGKGLTSTMAIRDG